MDKVVPSVPASSVLPEDKYRKRLTAKHDDLPQKEQKETKEKASFSESEILELVNEVNAHFTSFNQHLLVLINKNENILSLKIINTKTQDEVKSISPTELHEVARNLRNHKLTLIQRDV